MTFDKKVLSFYRTLSYPALAQENIEFIKPFEMPEVKKYTKSFYAKYYSDSKKRIFVLGINPGRFGSGVTGIPFTDPVALENICGISNKLQKRKELSSEFIYTFIKAWGGPKKFYDHFFLSAISPVGFTKNGINYNYYDDDNFLEELEPFLVSTLKKQIEFGARLDAVILFGTGKNQKVFKKLNDEHRFF